jgi:hypothetical protein
VADKPFVKKTVASAPAAKPVLDAKPVSKPVSATAEARTPVAETPVRIKPVVQAAAPVAAPAAAVADPIKTAAPVQVSAPAEGHKTMNDTFAKVEDTAKNFTADATERATAMFGDVSARAKTAMEKGSQSLEDCQGRAGNRKIFG